MSKITKIENVNGGTVGKETFDVTIRVEGPTGKALDMKVGDKVNFGEPADPEKEVYKGGRVAFENLSKETKDALNMFGVFGSCVGVTSQKEIDNFMYGMFGGSMPNRIVNKNPVRHVPVDKKDNNPPIKVGSVVHDPSDRRSVVVMQILPDGSFVLSDDGKTSRTVGPKTKLWHTNGPAPFKFEVSNTKFEIGDKVTMNGNGKELIVSGYTLDKLVMLKDENDMPYLPVPEKSLTVSSFLCRPPKPPVARCKILFV